MSELVLASLCRQSPINRKISRFISMPDDNGSATGGCSKHTYQTLRASGIRANRAVAYHHVPGQRGDTHHSGLGDSTQLPSCWPWRRVLQRLFANKSRSSSSHSKDVSKPAVMHYAARISSQTGSRASASSPQHDGTTAFKALPAEHDLLYPGLADTPKHGSLISAPSACSTVSEHCVRPCRMATGGSQSGIPGSPAPPPFVSISLDTNRAPSTGGMHAPNPHIWHASDEGEEELHVQDLVPPLTPKPYTTQRSRSVRFSDQSRAGSGRPMERDSTREELTALSSWISGEVRDSPPSRSTSSLNLQQMGDDLLNTLGSAASNVLHETGARLYPAPAAGSYSRGGDARPGPTDGSLQLRSHSSPAVQAVHGMGMCRRCKSHRQYGSRGSSQISAQTSGTLHRCSLENGKAEQPGRQHPKPEERHVHQDMAAVIEQEFTQGSTTSLSSPTLLRHDRAHTSAQLSMRQAHTQAGYVELEGHFAYPSARQRFGSTNVGVHPSSPQPLMRTQDSASSPLFAHSSLVAGPGSSCIVKAASTSVLHPLSPRQQQLQDQQPQLPVSALVRSYSHRTPECSDPLAQGARLHSRRGTQSVSLSMPGSSHMPAWFHKGSVPEVSGEDGVDVALSPTWRPSRRGSSGAFDDALHRLLVHVQPAVERRQHSHSQALQRPARGGGGGKRYEN